MDKQGQQHLTQEELHAWNDGEQRDLWMKKHLDTCTMCRERLKDLALLTELVGEKTRGPVKAHLPAETMAAYFDNSLAMDQQEEVKEHLNECDACLDEYVTLKKAQQLEVPTAPPEEMVQKAVRQMSQGPGRVPLGVVLMRKIKGIFEMDFTPSVLVQRFMCAEMPDFAPECAPNLKMPLMNYDRESSDLFLDDDVSENPEELSDEEPATPFEVQAGPVILEILPMGDAKGGFLVVTATNIDRDEPEVGMLISLFTKADVFFRSKTDAEGIVRIPIRAGRFRLEVSTDRLYELDLELSF